MRLNLSYRNIFLNIIGSAVAAFGLYHVHSVSGVSEGGVLGAMLLLYHWCSITPAISGFVIDCIAYIYGWKTLGKEFLLYSLVSNVSFSLTYAISEQFPRLFPRVVTYPLYAAVLGALFIGVGIGLCVLGGGAPGADDALAMALNKRYGWKIQRVYLASDLTVLLLSLSYIPFRRIAWSILTVVLSGQIIGFMQRFAPKPPKD